MKTTRYGYSKVEWQQDAGEGRSLTREVRFWDADFGGANGAAREAEKRAEDVRKTGAAPHVSRSSSGRYGHG